MIISDKKPTISIGLPAYNEEKNIGILLEHILKQEITKGELIEILVMSDGSTDKTIERAEAIKDPRIKIFNLEERKGKYAVENKIFTTAVGDVLVIFDCDVLPADVHVIDALLAPLLEDSSIGLVGAGTWPALPKNFFESILALSHKLKVDIYEQINHGSNLYLCHGRGRAFNRELYEPIVWPYGYPEDAFSYFFCLSKGLRFAYAKDARVVFRSPMTFRDHERQNHRYLNGKKKMEEYFKKEFVDKEYFIPKTLLFKTILKYLVISPVRTLCYCAITGYLWFISRGNKKYIVNWEMSQSSKEVL